MKHSLLGLVPLSVMVLCLGVTACGGDDDGGGNEEIGDATDDGTDDATDDATESSDTADTSTDTTEETTDTGPPPDADMDSVEDALDNCPDDPNPNQLDFDGDGEGNVCDVLTHATITGTLTSMAVVDAGFAGSCDVPLDFVSEGGLVQVQLDDNAQLVRIELTELQIADVLDKQCQLLVAAVVSIKDFSMVNGGGSFPATMPHNQGDHDAGVATGMTNIPHPVIAMGTLEAATGGDPPMPSVLDLPDANLPPMAVAVSAAGSAMELTWANDNFVIATSEFLIEMPIMITVDLQIVGLNGTLTLSP